MEQALDCSSSIPLSPRLRQAKLIQQTGRRLFFFLNLNSIITPSLPPPPTSSSFSLLALRHALFVQPKEVVLEKRRRKKKSSLQSLSPPLSHGCTSYCALKSQPVFRCQLIKAFTRPRTNMHKHARTHMLHALSAQVRHLYANVIMSAERKLGVGCV